MDISNPRQQSHILILVSCIAALGGFLFGYDTGVISGALVFLRSSFIISTQAQEIIVSSVVLGALVGAVSSGSLADRFGRKRMLMSMALTFIAGTILSALAGNVSVLIAGRFIIGIAIGITSYISPLFIAEMAPAAYRGRLVLLNGIMITGGETIAFLVDYALVPTHSWRLMFATGLLPAFLLLIGMLLVSETPRWLYLKGYVDQAQKILANIRNSQELETELAEIAASIQQSQSNWRELFSKFLRPVLIIGLGLGIFQQFVGINTVMYYGPTIFAAVGFKSNSAQLLATVGMGLANTVMSLVAVLVVDKIGRRKMLIGGLFIAAFSLGIVSFIFNYGIQSPLLVWTTFLFLILYIAGYSLSLGSLFWLVIAEIYPLSIRGFAMSFVSAVQWAANFIVALTFLSLLEWGGTVFTFRLYGFMCVISLIFCYFLVPETRGVTLERIETNLRLGKHSRQLGINTIG